MYYLIERETKMNYQIQRKSYSKLDQVRAIFIIEYRCIKNITFTNQKLVRNVKKEVQLTDN